jgi:hypothetical protein
MQQSNLSKEMAVPVFTFRPSTSKETWFRVYNCIAHFLLELIPLGDLQGGA